MRQNYIYYGKYRLQRLTWGVWQAKKLTLGIFYRHMGYFISSSQAIRHIATVALTDPPVWE